ncbi:MAG: DUF5916 domain-containing protein [Acidobacteriota bacterium]
MPSRNALVALVAHLLAGAFAGLAAASAAHAQTAPVRPAFVLTAVRAEEPPDIDGIVEDDEWAGAARIDVFVQFEPRRGEPATRPTEALVLYDAGHLYVAFRCRDDEPLTARRTTRDGGLLSDDAVALLIDTFHDRQTGYFFITNPLGTQEDGRLSDDGRQSDTAWDAAWQSAAARTEDGWSGEFAIPFTSIKYASGNNVTWGINLARTRRRTLEFDTWSFPLDDTGRVSQAGQLVGLEIEPPARRIQVIPYGLGRAQRSEAGDVQAGVDVRYNLTTTTAIYGTLNPDFATIEADVEEVNLTRFEVSLREKRQFFLEGNELYGQRIRTFYSRRIEDILAGGKVLGKQGPWTTAFLTTQTDPIADDGRANFTVGRLQRDVFGRSSVAVMFDNRGRDGQNNGSLSLDTNLFFTRTWGMTAQVVQSWGGYGRGGAAFFVRPSYDSSTGHFHVRYTHLGDRLRDNLNVIGRIPDDDRRELDSAVNKTIWVKGGPFEQIQYDSNYNVYWSQTGVLRSWQIDQSLEVEFRNRMSAEVSVTEEFKRFEKDFRNRQIGLQFGYNTREYQSVSAGVEFGRNFDADFQLWEVSARHKLTEQLSTEYSLERLVLRPDPEGESTWIHVVRANQFFTKDLFLRVLFQTNTAIDRQNLQAIFVWRYLPPFGTIQLAYQRGTAGFGERSDQGHTLFVKATAVF